MKKGLVGVSILLFLSIQGVFGQNNLGLYFGQVFSGFKYENSSDLERALLVRRIGKINLTDQVSMPI